MKRLLTSGIVVVLLVALGVLVAMAARGGTASAASQYNRPKLTLQATNFVPGNYFTFHVVGSGYTDPYPAGTLQLTCARGSDCGPNPTWDEGAVDPAFGSFSVDFFYGCPSGVKSAVAVDANGVKSSPAKAAC
jgi:hypothetical protein